MSSNTPIRRSSRVSRPSLKAANSEFISRLKSSGFVQTLSDEDDFTDEEVYNNVSKDIEKPSVLHENEVVPGEDIYKFPSRKHRANLAQKVAETNSQKTPYVVRCKKKSKISKLIEEDSESEYEVSVEEISSSEEESSIATSDSEEDQPKTKITKSQVIKTSLQPTRIKGGGKYVINTEEYFENSTNKAKTSNNTLDKLETPRLPQYQLQKLLQSTNLSKQHSEAVDRLAKLNKSYFKKWLYLLHENFNILLYGLGSKRDTIRKFQSEYLTDMPVIVVNGFFPTITLKNILDGIIVDLLELSDNPTNPNEACDLIIQEFKNMPNVHLYVIIHNIEGEMIRNGKCQNILAKLVNVRNIHLIASIDHINGPLIWDHGKLSKFKYIWWDVTSFSPYTEETCYERSMMVQQTGSLALSSLRNVFLSLTTNSKSIYMIIAKHQVENEKNQYYQGIAFKDLYLACREAFVVSSDLALRAQLQEFVDHKMVKIRRNVDGAEYLIIPIANGVLQKFLDEHS